MIRNNTFLILAISFVLFPIFFIDNGWDGTIIDYGFTINNLDGVKIWYEESSSNFQLFIINFLFFLKNKFNLSNEIIFDTFTSLSLLLFCFEVQKYSEKVFEFNKKWSRICLIIILTFPVWHSLTSINLGLYIFCFYLALLGYRFYSSNNIPIRLLGILIMMFSFSIKSNFTFIIALSLCENLNRYLKKKSINKFSLLFILLFSVTAYLTNSIFFPPYGLYENYNQTSLANFDIIKFLKNIYDFLTFFIFYLWFPIILFIYFKLLKKNKLLFLDNKFIFNFISLFIFFTIIITPYLLVQKSTDLFFFSDYMSRHAYLVSISFSVFFTLLIKALAENKNHLSSKCLTLLIIIQSVFILSLSYFIKIDKTLIKNNLAHNLKTIDKPKSGYVLIISKELKNSFIRTVELNNLFFEVYGEAAWKVKFINDINSIKTIDIKSYFRESDIIKSNKNYSIKYIFNDFQGSCITIYKIKNELNKIESIKKLYIFNQNNYFKIEYIKEVC